MKVLIADDQPEFVSSIVNEIRRAGFVSESVPDADSALLRIRERVYDLILTDLQMPPGNWGGLEFIKTARLIDPLVPIVVVSGKGSLSECVQAMRLGATNYIQKESFTDEFTQWSGNYYKEPYAISGYPSLVGYLYRSFEEEEVPYLKARRLVDLIEATERLLLCIVLGERCSQEKVEPEVLVRKLGLGRATLGDYVAVLFDQLKASPPALFSRFLIGPEIGHLREDLDQFTNCRNKKFGHSATLSPSQAEAVIAEFYPKALRVLNRLSFLRRCELLRVDSLQFDGEHYNLKGQLLKGHDLYFAVATRAVTAPARSGHIVMLKDGVLIADLDPFVRIRPVVADHIYRYELYDRLVERGMTHWAVPRLEH